jgi:hypothetical protein
VYGGYDAPLFDPDDDASLQPSSQLFSGADVSLDYARPGRRVIFSTNVSLSNRYYPNFTPSSAPSYGAGATLTSNNRGRWQWALSQFAHYAPFTATSLFALANAPNAQSLVLASTTAFQQSTIRQLDLNTMGSLTYSMSRRTNIGLTVLGGTLVPIDSPVPRAVRINGNLRLSRQLTRSLGAYVAYTYSQNRVASSGASPSANYEIGGIDFGLDFARPIQLGRNTTIGFRAGLLSVPGTGGSTYQLTGGVSVDHYFGRSSWAAQLYANRDARFVQTYRNAVAYNGISLSAGGRLVGNLGTIFTSNYSSGTINAASAVDFHSYSASVLARYDIGRIFGTFAEYSAFVSDVDDSRLLVGQPTGRFGRHGVRVGLAFGVSPFARNRLP